MGLVAKFHSLGDRMLNGDRNDRALMGDSVLGDHMGDCGMRRRRGAPVAGADKGFV